jgi:hypothetical protein
MGIMFAMWMELIFSYAIGLHGQVCGLDSMATHYNAYSP